jgi:hypothetical protein
MSKIILTIALTFLLLFSETTFPQNTPTRTSTKAAPKKIGVAFSKAAIKTLFTIQGNSGKGLVDAAMIDLNVAVSNHTELLIAQRIQLFDEIYGINEMVRRMAIRAGREESLADPDLPPADCGANESHDKDQACIAAWVPRLRALSAEVPKQCP